LQEFYAFADGYLTPATSATPATPAPTAIPASTPATAPTPAITSTRTLAPASQTNGFEAVSAVSGIVAAAYLLRKIRS